MTAHEQFGRAIVQRNNIVGEVRGLHERGGQPEVSKLEDTIGVYEEVGGFDISVHNTRSVALI